LLLFCGARGKAVERFHKSWDFGKEGLAGWVVEEGDWRVEEGALVHYDKFFKGGMCVLERPRLSEGVVEVELKLVKTYWNKRTVWGGVVVRGQELVRRGPFSSGYLVIVRAEGQVEVIRAPDGLSLGRGKSKRKPTEAAVHLKVETKGNKLKVWVDGKLEIEAEDATYEAGEVALENFGCGASFAKVKVEGKAAPEVEPKAVEAMQPKPERKAPVKPLPRIRAERRPGEGGIFVEAESRQRFVPLGFNHTVLAKGWHSTFNVGVYDPEALERTLAQMEAAGANCVRVWAWGKQGPDGFTGGRKSRGLNGAYMENFVDFLRRATRHKIYVIAIMDEEPRNAYYDWIAAKAERKETGVPITGHTSQFLTEGAIAAKAQCIKDFIGYVKEADAGLLRTVLGWELANEICVNYSEGPFSYKEGQVRPADGKVYDMGDFAARQRCYDESISYWAKRLSEAVKAVDPEALVTAGCWTADQSGRAAINGVEDDGKDTRVPPRPSVLGAKASGLDCVDIHVYPWGGKAEVDAQAHEAEQVKAEGAPVLVGEIGGGAKAEWPEAKAQLERLAEGSARLGYTGALFWVWDLRSAQARVSAVEDDYARQILGVFKRYFGR